jgi:hypothetical protein
MIIAVLIVLDNVISRIKSSNKIKKISKSIFQFKI